MTPREERHVPECNCDYDYLGANQWRHIWDPRCAALNEEGDGGNVASRPNAEGRADSANRRDPRCVSRRTVGGEHVHAAAPLCRDCGGSLSVSCYCTERKMMAASEAEANSHVSAPFRGALNAWARGQR